MFPPHRSIPTSLQPTSNRSTINFILVLKLAWVLFFIVIAGCGSVNGIQESPESLSLAASLAPLASTSPSRVCWGDLHGHTTMSDGTISPKAYFTLAQDEALLDFVALTDHVYHPEPLNRIKWTDIIEIAAAHHNPESFITFTGFEWTTSGGHFSVYFPGDNPQIFVDAFPKNMDDLSKYVEKAGGLIHLAHPGFLEPLGWKIDHLKNVTNAEITGALGMIFETEYRRLLTKGMKLGVVGVSDIHTGPPGMLGLTAVWVSQCTQQDILEALRTRRNYASTGERVELVFQADGHWMGEEYSPNVPPLLAVEVKASTAIKSVTILDEEDTRLFVSTPQSSSAKIEYKVKNWTGQPHYYQVKIEMMNGHLAWSSPIWTN